MMQLNYYFLKKLLEELTPILQEMSLATAFSQNKDEIILGFYKGQQEYYIRATLQSDFTTLSFLTDFQRAKKNSADLFTQLWGHQIASLELLSNDRSFLINFTSGYALLFKMHGNRSNILLLNTENKVIQLFKKKLGKDYHLTPGQLSRSINQSYKYFEETGGDLKKVYPVFDKLVYSYLGNLNSLSLLAQWESVQAVIALLENPTFYIGTYQELPVLSLLALKELDIEQEYSSAIEAANAYYYTYATRFTFEKQKQITQKKLESLQQRAQSYIEKSFEKLVELEQQASLEEIGHILMANLHAIPSQSKEVELHDFYREQSIQIKLKPDLSPQKNAELYYKKAKNQKIEIEKIQENIQAKETQLEQISQKLALLANVSSHRELQKFIKENTAIFSEEDKLALPFKQYEYMGFKIWVGRNAQNNDLLTQKYAFKEDLWLHAKDVSGSHVVIKYQAGKPFPKPVVEKAAQIAAYFSKRKNDSVCPVIVTPKKFVRKTKDLAYGQVIVEKEDILLVTPQEP